ncbi:hypothetical protein [Rhizobium sp.]|uniref:hypothetical protein n=1 Tax=Rhizobium sp. TaxID=391 RepID=UPI0034C6C2A0
MKDKITFTLPFNDPIAMREFERATGAVRFEIAPEAPAARVISALYEKAVQRCAGPEAISVYESYAWFRSDVDQINTGRSEKVVAPEAAHFRKTIARKLKAFERTRHAERTRTLAHHLGSELALYLDEIQLDGSHLKSTLERTGVWNLMPQEEQEQILNLSPWMVVVFDTRTKLIHSLRFHPLLPHPTSTPG